MGHNAFDFVEDDPGFQSTPWWDFCIMVFTAHEILPGHNAMLVYAFPVWTGVMLLGYGLGQWFVADYSAEKRRKELVEYGFGFACFFVLLRFTNWYGDPIDWSVQATPLLTFLPLSMWINTRIFTLLVDHAWFCFDFSGCVGKGKEQANSYAYGVWSFCTAFLLHTSPLSYSCVGYRSFYAWTHYGRGIQP